MEDFMDEDDLEGMHPLVLSLEKESRKMAGMFVTPIRNGDENLMSPWVGGEERTETRNKLTNRRLCQPKDKEHRSVTPRKLLSRQQVRSGHDEVEFRHYQDSGTYMEEYRNDKLQRQEALLRDLLMKNARRRASDSCLNCLKTPDLNEKPVEPPQQVAEQKPNPLIVISSRGSSRPCNLPLEGHFQGRKLQGRSQVHPRTTYVHRESLWHQSIGSTTTSVSTLDLGRAASNGVQERPSAAVEKQPISASSVKRTNLCTSAKSSKSSIGPTVASVTRQASPLQPSTNISAAIEKCGSWVKNRDQELENAQSNDRLSRSSSAHTLHVSSRPGSMKAQQDVAKSGAGSGNSNQVSTSKSSPAIDYSHYTDMFKNVLEFYGPKRLPPKSNASLDHQLLSLKT